MLLPSEVTKDANCNQNYGREEDNLSFSFWFWQGDVWDNALFYHQVNGSFQGLAEVDGGVLVL